MLPINRFQQLPQNKIAGLNVAYGRAIYAYPQQTEDGSEGFVFEAPESFQLTVDPGHFRQDLNLSMEALMDCVDQVEEQLGRPSDTAERYGMAPRSGFESIGLVFRSRVDDRVCCVFTPTNFEFEVENFTWPNKVEGFFAWYLQDKGPSDYYRSIQDMLSDMTKQAGTAHVSTFASPMLPSYFDAAQALESLGHSRSAPFLDRLWLYEHSMLPGAKLAEEPWLKAAWTTLKVEASKGRRV